MHVGRKVHHMTPANGKVRLGREDILLKAKRRN